MIPIPTLTGGGFIGIAGGAVILNGAFEGHLSCTDGAINRGSALTVPTNSVLDLSGSTGNSISGQLTVSAGGALNLLGSGTTTLCATLTNSGTVNWQGGRPCPGGARRWDDYYGYICNQPSGLFDIRCDQALTYSTSATFDNAGLSARARAPAPPWSPSNSTTREPWN